MEEAARSVDEKWSAKQLARNANIVADHVEKNVTFGWIDGEWKHVEKKEDVGAIVAYGDERARRVFRKQRAESFETTGIVSHLPKSLLTEVPDFYDTGRSRWVCSEEVALDYAEKVREFLSQNVLRGGKESIHAVSVHFDESVPHVHVMCDTYADDVKHEGWLSCYAQHMWGQRREEGDKRALTGSTKLREYQKEFREYLNAHGIEVEQEVSVRSRSSMTKDEYAAMQERERDVENREKAVSVDEKHLETRKDVWDGILRDKRKDVAAREKVVAEKEEAVQALTAQAEQVKLDAEHDAASVRAQAEHDAVNVRAQAQADAESVLAQAEQVKHNAEQEAASIRLKATNKADEIVSDAQDEAHTIISSAQADAQRQAQHITSQALQRQRELEEELEEAKKAYETKRAALADSFTREEVNYLTHQASINIIARYEGVDKAEEILDAERQALLKGIINDAFWSKKGSLSEEQRQAIDNETVGEHEREQQREHEAMQRKLAAERQNQQEKQSSRGYSIGFGGW